MIRSLAYFASVLLVGMTMGGCSKASLSEEELLKLLAEAVRVGPYQFEHQTWPLIENKEIVYCGPIDEVLEVGSTSLVLLKVEKTVAGVQLPWSLETKTPSRDFAQSHKAGDPICIKGNFKSYMQQDNKYRGYINVLSLEKPTS
jgi:hypothetical protein